LCREREYQSRYRELADHGEFRRVSEVLDEDWIKNCLELTGWTLGLDIALANLGSASARPSPTCASPSTR
jgi:hypothetical protein